MPIRIGERIITRTIVTVYRRGNNILKKNRAKDPNKAVLHAVQHMQFNTYSAQVAEVYDEETGLLHAVIRLSGRNLTIVYKRAVKENY